MVRRRGLETVRISKVKRHADDEMVRMGSVRAIDTIGNDLSDRAASFGRRRVPVQVIDLRRHCAAACSFWYPLVLELGRFFIAIARAVVNEDGHGGTAFHPTVWSERGLAKRRKVVQAIWEYAWVPGPPGLWRHGSVGLLCAEVIAADARCWPFSVGILVKMCAFLGSLHWPRTAEDLYVGDVSYTELLILHERWAGERLV